ncbi:type VII secretion protein EssA [Listeria goaensis]|uniref:type VII secretion protein EssA n=1 Tax=Listeria goaensis TaxID=1649188 RepID=UPI000B5947C6|nr:type VII secretion protein EssA [Listeria goaensis]
MKICKSVIFSLFLLMFVSVSGATVFAENGYLENDGKMEMKADRLQKSEEEKTQTTEQEKTMLDELGLPLFTDELDKKIEQQEKEQKEKYKELQDSLFTGKEVTNQTAKDTQKKLFEGNYALKADEEVVEDTKEDKTSNSMIAIIGGIVLALAGGIYFASRHVME